MEQHPVPRNISGFQFHLIGDMTVRQFAYLAAGVFIAYLSFRFAPFPPILRFPLAGICALGGFALAFLPIQDRPLDKWLVLFFRSITSPTQFLWHKEGILPDVLTMPAYTTHPTVSAAHVEAHQDANEKLRSYLATVPAQPHDYINQHEKKYLDATLSLFNRLDIPANTAPISPPTITPSPVVNTPISVRPQSPPSTQQKPVISSPELKPLTPITPSAPPSVQSPLESDRPLQPMADSGEIIKNVPAKKEDQQSTTNHQQLNTEFSQLLAEKERLAKELELLKNQTAQLTQPAWPAGRPNVIQPQPSTVPQQPTIVTIAPQAAASEFGLPNLPQTPNLVIGVVKDPGRKILPNVILTIKDGKGMPMRALKTNKLGQFETATPLPNGTYLLEIEDPLKRYTFDTAQITLSGKIFLPIEVTAKGEKEIMREKLSRELFGNAGVNANI